MDDIESILDSPRAGELVGDPVIRVAPEATLHEIASVLHDGGIGVVGVGDDKIPTGVVSERDLVRALAERRDPETTTASEICHSEIHWVDPNATVSGVASEMMNTWSRHALVGDGRTLHGIISARDLLGVIAAAGDDPVT